MLLSDIVQFIIGNRGTSDAFKDWSKEQIELEVVKGIQTSCFVVDIDGDGNIIGVVLCEADPAYRVLHIKQILILPYAQNTLKRFLKEYCRLYPDWDIQATRKDNLIRYKNTPRLLRLLSKISL